MGSNLGCFTKLHGILLIRNDLHSSISAIVSVSPNLVLLVTITIKYLVYLGITYKISNKKRLTWSFLNMLKNFLKPASFLAFLKFGRNGGGGFPSIYSATFVFGYSSFHKLLAFLGCTCFFSTHFRTNSTYNFCFTLEISQWGLYHS